MPSRRDYLEALDAIEDGMTRVAETRDIWQNRLIYAMCQAIRLLLLDAIKRRSKADGNL